MNIFIFTQPSCLPPPKSMLRSAEVIGQFTLNTLIAVHLFLNE